MVNNIHHTAIVDPKADIGKGVEIGPFTIINSNVVLGDGCRIGSHCEIGVQTPLSDGTPLVIGTESIIRSHSVFYESSLFGDKLVTGHRVTVREHTVAGKNLQIGTLCDIQGDCIVGDYVRFHSNVHIGKKSTIGNFVWIFPYVVLTNDPTPPSEVLEGVTIEDYASIATMAVLLPGVRVGEHSLVAAHACVARDVPKNSIAGGVPAKILGKTEAIMRRDVPNESAYPWPKHFLRGYPEDVVTKWQKEFHIDEN